MPKGKYRREFKHYKQLMKYCFVGGERKNHKWSEKSRKKFSLLKKELHKSGKLVVWNKGLTISDPRVKKYTLSRINSPEYVNIKRKIGLTNSISLLGHIPHNKGKTKIDYEPTRRTSEKLTGRSLSKERREKCRKARLSQKMEHVAKYEIFLTKLLIDKGIDVIPQYAISRKNFLTFVDLYIPSKKLCIYLDGIYFHKNKEQRDNEVSFVLNEMGFSILRIKYSSFRSLTKEDIQSHLDLILSHINNDIV